MAIYKSLGAKEENGGNETRQKHIEVIDGLIEDIKANGLFSWRRKQSIDLNLGQDINQERGFKIKKSLVQFKFEFGIKICSHSALG